MSLSGPLNGITFSGVNSGLDVDSIIRQLITLERLPIQRFQVQKAELSQKQDLYSAMRSRLLDLEDSLKSLGKSSTYTAVTASSSDEDVATISATEFAQAGSYSLSVSNLAQAHKAASTAQASVSEALGHAGTITVNGKSIEISADDALTDIAGKINEADARVTASVINGGEGSAYLSLTAQGSGVQGRLSLADVSGTVLQDLGVTTGATSVRETVGGAARSIGFTAADESLEDLTGLSPSGSFTVNGNAVSVDFSTDTLEALVTKINAVEPDAARIVEIESGGKTLQTLEITGTLADGSQILETLGVLQRGYGNELAAAEDAAYTLDGIALTSAENTLTDIIPSATVTLKKEDSATLELVRDAEGVKDALKEFEKTYNAAVDFIKANAAFNEENFASGPLFADGTAAQVESALANMLWADRGQEGTSNLVELGFRLDSEGRVSLDDAAYSAAIAEDPNAVRNVMETVWQASTGIELLGYAGAAPPLDADYQVNISQEAVKSLTRATSPQNNSMIFAENLTFSGTAFSSGDVVLSFGIGDTQQDVIDTINGDSRLNGVLRAYSDSGVLVIEALEYGAGSDFTAVSDRDPDGSNSSTGIGTGGGTKTDGQDIAGTIGGESATGLGAVLTADDASENTAGVSVRYTGASTGVVGAVSITGGLSDILQDRVTSFTDFTNGLLKAEDNGITGQIEDIDRQIAELEKRLVDREALLRRRFAAMEEAIGILNAQQTQFAAGFAQQ